MHQKLVVFLAGVFVLAGAARAATTFILPDITVTSLSHASSVTYNGENNYVVDDNIATFTPPSGSTTTIPTYASGDTIVQHFLAPAGMRFVFHLTPPGSTPSQGGSIFAKSNWAGTIQFGAQVRQTPTTVSFDALTGNAATLAPISLGDINGDTKGVFVNPGATLNANSSTDFSFTALAVSMIVPGTSPGGSGTLTLGSVTLHATYSWSIAGPPTTAVADPVLTLQPVPEPTMLVVVTSMVPLLVRPRRRRD